jgi:3-polyprenyl-4-hydroxybenzoate decarboxylase
MAYQSLGEFIKAADAIGEVRHVEGANLELDVGCLTELTAKRNGPMLVFDKFAGYAAGCRYPKVACLCPPRLRSSSRA